MEFIVLHPAAKDISNQRFGRLLALGPSHVKKFPSGANHVQWLCRCDCGTEKVISISKLSNGNTKSCGCLQKECWGQNKGGTTHGMHKTPEYEVWHGMKQRCELPTSFGFKHYGARGITVCERWQTFEVFFADMGSRPSPRHTIERDNNDGNYEPNNCRWATRKEQGRNRRSNFIVQAFGRSEPLICFVSDMKQYHRAWQRIKYGWNVERALTTPAYGQAS